MVNAVAAANDDAVLGPVIERHLIRKSDARIPGVLAVAVQSEVIVEFGDARGNRSAVIVGNGCTSQSTRSGWIRVRQGWIKPSVASLGVAEVADVVVAQPQVQSEVLGDLKVILRVASDFPTAIGTVKQAQQIERAKQVANLCATGTWACAARQTQQEVRPAEEEFARKIVEADLVVLLTRNFGAKAEVVLAVRPRHGILEGECVFRDLDVLAVAAEGKSGATAGVDGD